MYNINDSHRKPRYHRLISLLCCTAAGAILLGCGNSHAEDTLCNTSIFSWEASYITEENEALVSDAMKRLSCRSIYQHIPRITPEPLVLSFLERRHQQEQEVYYLAGESEWGIETDAQHMKETIETVCNWNDKAGSDAGFAGIVWDIEPYLLDAWEDNKQGYMEQFSKNCIDTYESAHKQGLYIIVCIPNFYDAIRLRDPLESLIESGCDAIAVMNYDKRDEISQIADEAQLAAKHRKALINITELQKPGYHHLTEQNTYYHDGLQAVEESWEQLKQAYPDIRLGFSWHYLKPALELLEKEE